MCMMMILYFNHDDNVGYDNGDDFGVRYHILVYNGRA